MNESIWLWRNARSLRSVAVTTAMALATLMVIAQLSQAGELQTARASAVAAKSEIVTPVSLPAAIRAEAQRRGVALSSVQRQGEYWVACEGSGSNAFCTVLGRVAAEPLTAEAPAKLTGLPGNAVLEVHQYGHAVQTLALTQANSFGRVVRTAQGSSFELKPGVEARISVQGRKDQMIDTLPRYRREGVNLVRTKDFQLVREYIDARPDEPFTVVVTVPALCEPCRRLDQLVMDNVRRNPATSTPGQGKLLTKMFILEYFSFADAEREVLGSGAVFPTTLVYGAESQPRKSISRLVGNLRGSSMEEISRTLTQRLRRGSPHTMSRGVVAQELLFRM